MINNKDIGFFLIKMNNSPTYDRILSTIADFIKHNPYNQYVVFNSFSDKMDTFNIPILHINQAKFFYGDLFVFDFMSCLLTQKFPNLSNRYLYSKDLFWTDDPGNSYREWNDVIMSDNLNIITHHKYTYDIYDICWKTPIGISENFNYEELKNIL